MRKIRNKIVIVVMSAVAIVAGVMYNSCMLGGKSNASEISQDKSVDNEYNYDNFIDNVDNKSIVKIQDNELVYNEELLKKECGKLESSTDTNEDVYEILINNMEILNEGLEDGTYTVMPDGSIMGTHELQAITRGGKTYDKKYWWGVMRYKSTSAASKWAKEINNLAANEAGAAGVAGAASAFLGPIVAIPAGIGAILSADCYKLANEINYYNSLSKNGVKVKMPWTCFGWKVSKQ